MRIIYEMDDDTIKHFSKHIGITVSAISEESKKYAVSDENFLSFFQRLTRRLSILKILKITLSPYTYTDTPKNTEYKIQNTKYKIQNTEIRGNTKKTEELKKTAHALIGKNMR